MEINAAHHDDYNKQKKLQIANLNKNWRVISKINYPVLYKRFKLLCQGL